MSETKKKTEQQQNKEPAAVEQVQNVVRAVGTWHGYNPLPRRSHKWMLASHIKLSPTCYVMWAWLFDHSLALGAAAYSKEYGQRSPYAVVIRKNAEGKEETVIATLEHMAADLGIEIHNLRKYWNEGIEAGIWRNGKGTPKEDKKSLYLSTEVKAAPEKGLEAPDSGVCTYPWEKLPSYVSSHLQTLATDRIANFWEKYHVTETVDKMLQAETVAVDREVMGQEQDSLFEEFGARKIRQEHKKNGATPEEIQARAERTAVLRETIKGYVHTLRKFVQSAPNGSYKPAYTPPPAAASLLPESTPRERPEAGRQNLQNAPPSRQEPLPDGGKKSVKQLPVPESPVSAPIKISEAESAFFAELASWKNDFQHCDFGNEEISKRNKGQVATVRRIVAAVKEDLTGFFPYVSVRLEKLNTRPAMGKRVGRVLGLILEWAGDYARSVPERARKEKEKREAFAQAAENSNALNKELERDAVKAAIRTLKDQTSNEADCQEAREFLESLGIQYGAEEKRRSATDA